MSKRRANIEPEISDDDDSFETLLYSRAVDKTVVISSDSEDSERKEHNPANLSSDSDSPLSKVVSINKRTIENAEKAKIIRKLFPNSKPGVVRKNETNKNMPEPEPSVAFVHEIKAPGHIKMIGGVQVHFPVPPYGCQVALIYKIIKGISNRENCLLESPTGSGKTLALLCGALAWQRHERKRLNKIQEEHYFSQSSEQSELKSTASSWLPSSSTSGSKSNTQTLDIPDNLFSKTNFGGGRSIYDKLQLCNPNKRFEPDSDHGHVTPPENQVTIHKRPKLNSSDINTSPAKVTPATQSTPEKGTDNTTTESPRSERLPTIYYGARTHKQLQQVVKEFKATSYCGEAKMSILSSREYSCIRPFDRQIYASKNDMCRTCCKEKKLDKRKMDPKSANEAATDCEFFNRKEKMNHNCLPPAFDLEDLVKKGNEIKACPFYAARRMAAVSQIVFCPYNYLIDPTIRKSLQINLQNEILILDEAHNIEDICRDAATFTITRDDFGSAIKELEHLSSYQSSNEDIMEDMLSILKSLKNWDQWFHNQMVLVDSKPMNNNEAIFAWEVEHFVQSLEDHNICKATYTEFVHSAEVFCEKLRDSSHNMMGTSQATGTLVETIATIFTYLYGEDGKYMNDFKPVLVKTTVESMEPETGIFGWKSTQQTKVSRSAASLRLLCLNPAVVFGSLRAARCVVLASGTLAPRASLPSELATPFPHSVSPAHVIPPDRVWVGTLSTTPDGRPLECQMRGASLPHTQDALGAAVRWVSRVTPHGVLCFLPSYFLMNKLVQRWKDTGLWKELNDIKYVFKESRNVKDHGEIMEEYYNNVETVKGALLFAVYRGKVSEGMDFKDKQARAVITVGIPYPNTTDIMVREKMAYNKKYAQEKNLLSSEEWLKVQAYRALNQAAGRCVRHRGDWGAVLLVDARFCRTHYVEPLPAWLRALLGDNHHTYNSLVNSPNSLESFMQAMTIRENEESV